MLYRLTLLLFFIYGSLLSASTLHPNKKIQLAIENKYLEYYPTLRIKQLTIKALGREPKKFSTYHMEKITLSEASLKRNHGTFSVLYNNGKKKKKRFFKFKLQGTIGIYISNHYLKKGTHLHPSDVTYKEIVFERIPILPIDESYLYDYETKRSIREGKIVTVRDLRRVLDVKRDQLLDATLYDGNIQLTFKVKSLQEGNIGDIIKVKRGYYKKFRAQITSKNSVDIIE